VPFVPFVVKFLNHEKHEKHENFAGTMAYLPRSFGVNAEVIAQNLKLLHSIHRSTFRSEGSDKRESPATLGGFPLSRE
jgi:hypothetical protein